MMLVSQASQHSEELLLVPERGVACLQAVHSGAEDESAGRPLKAPQGFRATGEHGTGLDSAWTRPFGDSNSQRLHVEDCGGLQRRGVHTPRHASPDSRSSCTSNPTPWTPWVGSAKVCVCMCPVSGMGLVPPRPPGSAHPSPPASSPPPVLLSAPLEPSACPQVLVLRVHSTQGRDQR